ncbi:MAG: hypothetical protein ACLUNO_04060 [Oscillospiraceae bacterium]
MAYNGFWADFLFNTGVVAAWCVFCGACSTGRAFRGGARCCSRS